MSILTEYKDKISMRTKNKSTITFRLADETTNNLIELSELLDTSKTAALEFCVAEILHQIKEEEE